MRSFECQANSDIRQVFVPSEAEKESADTGSNDGESPLPDLPDVPTTEPTEEGQSKPKKARLDDGDRDN